MTMGFARVEDARLMGSALALLTMILLMLGAVLVGTMATPDQATMTGASAACFALATVAAGIAGYSWAIVRESHHVKKQ